MKKIYYLIAMAVTAFTFTSCEDVPEPFGQPINPNKGGETVVVEPTGSGTEADPYNVTKVTDVTKAMADGDIKNDVYTKGYICQIDDMDTDGSYGNSTYWISDDAEGKSGKYEVFRGYGLGGQKFNETGATIIKVGDAVTIKGNIKNFKGNTPEYDTGSIIVELNGVKAGGSGGGSTGDAKAVSVADFLAAAESTTDWYQLKGTVKNLKDGDQYGNFDIEDATGSVYVYGLVAEKGGEKKKFQELVAAKGIANGKTITIIGNRGAYNGTAQVANAYFVSIEGDTPPTPSGDNLLTNGDFETWSGSTPTNWKTSSSAGNATLAQSSDAHGGSYSVSVGFAADANKRLGYKETTLKAGTYTFSFYAKATTAEKSQTQAGFVNIKDDGKTDKYTYGGYVSLTNTEWTLVSTTFTLAADTKVSLVMMCPKNSDYAVAQNILVDDASLVTSDGGIADDGGEGGGGDTPSSGTGTLANPLTASQVYDIVAAMESGVTSTEDYYVKGKICSIKFEYSAQYGTATFNISDDGNTGSKEFIAYSTYYHASEQKWKEGDTQVAVGDEVVICGKVVNYNGNTPEFASKKSYVVSISK